PPRYSGNIPPELAILFGIGLRSNSWWIGVIVRQKYIRLGVIFSVVSFAFSAFAELDGGVRNHAGWEPLFNGKDLTGWYTFLQQHGKNADPDHVVSVDNGMIHLYRDAPQGGHVVMGYIATENEYENYHLSLEYKWGKKTFEPRLAAPRDAGVYYHIV